MPSELPDMKRQWMMVAIPFLIASCREGNQRVDNDIRCGLRDPEISVPLILKEQARCPSCLSGQVAKAVRNCPDDRALLALGMYSAYKSSDLSAAAIYYERLVISKGASVEQHADAGYIYTQLRMSPQALHAFELAVAGGADTFVQFEFAKSLYQANRNREAVLILEKIMKENPKKLSENGMTVIGGDAVYDQADALLKKISHEANRTRAN